MTTVGTSRAISSPAERSPWHSPMPYLFGGLAAMLALIAIALLILACSYWKLSRNRESGDGAADRDLEAGGDDPDASLKAPPVLEQKFAVIMPGQEKPTCLATPISSRASSFGNRSCTTETAEKSEDLTEKPKELSVDQVQPGNMDDHETADPVP